EELDEGSDLPILDPEEDDLDDEEPLAVLITGAAGNIGSKLRNAWEGQYDLVLLDRDPRGDPDILEAELADPAGGWIEHFHGVDVVVHREGNPNEFASWEELAGPNIGALANVLHAAVLAGVERVIFASSNHAMGDYREFGDMPIAVNFPPKPDGPYGGL